MNRKLALVLLTLFSLPASAFAQLFIEVSTAGALQDAINDVDDGGVVEVAAGTYNVPAPSLLLINPNRKFTIRAAQGATVTFQGGGGDGMFEYLVDNDTRRGHVTFQDIIFNGGAATNVNRAGAVTVSNGAVTFIRCQFLNNTTTGSNAAGAVIGFNGAHLVVIDSLFQDNTYTGNGAGLRISEGNLYVHGTQFIRNLNNIPGHQSDATGAAIHTFDSVTYVTNSRFEDNETALAGGAIYGIGTWNMPYNVPSNTITVANSSFVGNIADPPAAVAFPPEGGTIQLEDQAHINIYNSRIDEGFAELGGGLSLYRATGLVEDSVFRGNQAISNDTMTGFGAAIKVSSDDLATDADNYPPTSLTIRDSLIQGRFNGVTTVSRAGGGIFAQGDNARAFGNGGVPQMGTVDENRATLVVERVVFYDLDLDFDGSATRGGAINTAMANVTISDSLFLGNDSMSSGGSGGAILAQGQGVVTITDSSFVENTADTEGGAIHALGAEINVSNSHFIRNEVSPGVTEPIGASLGAAIATGFQENFLGQGNLDFDVEGAITNNTFSNQVGLALFERDRDTVPINRVQYGSNEFFESSFSGDVYNNSFAFQPRTPEELNSYVVSHTGTSDITKSLSDNSTLGSVPSLGRILAVPPAALTPSAGEGGTSTPTFAGYGWEGGTATFNSAGTTDRHAVESVSTGTHTLNVDGDNFTDNVSNGPNAAGTFTATPTMITSGGTSTLDWATTAGGFLTLVHDHDLDAGNNASGSIMVGPPLTRTYSLLIVTEAGGASIGTTVFVDEDPPDIIFGDGFESGDLTAWDTSVGSR